ncbi:MAG: hypothetical protein ACTSPE_09420 [Candidatus Thorarchaeota archaeon]
MRASQLYRRTVRYATVLGVSCIAAAALSTPLPFMPPFSDYFPFLEPVLVVIWAVGLLGTSTGITHYTGIVREGRSVWSELMNHVENAVLEPTSELQRQAPYLLADSIDREALAILAETGGDLLDVQDELDGRGIVPRGDAFLRRMTKLVALGLVTPHKEMKRVYLTSAGMDAVNTPAALFVSHIPGRVWNHVFQAKMSLLQEKWGNVVVETAKALEASMRELLASSIEREPEKWGDVRKRMSSKAVERWTAGTLLGALRAMGAVKPRSLEDFLAGELVKTRNRVHAEGEMAFGAPDAEKCDIYLSLLIRSWFGPR